MRPHNFEVSQTWHKCVYSPHGRAILLDKNQSCPFCSHIRGPGLEVVSVDCERKVITMRGITDDQDTGGMDAC